MAVTVRLDPNLEKVLDSLARDAGLSVEGYIERLLRKHTSSLSQDWNLRGQELESELDGITAYSEKIPLLPLSALTRDAIYQDHD